MNFNEIASARYSCRKYDTYRPVEEEKINDLGYKLTVDKLKDGIKIKKGKKVYHKVMV